MDFTPIYINILKLIVPIFLFGFALLILKGFLEKKLSRKENTSKKSASLTEIHPSRFHKKKPLTEPEQITFFKLVSALPDYVILPQVAFSSFITTKGGTKKQNFARFGQARQKVIDYLICDKAFEIIAAIELDDSSHIGREKQDNKKNEILNEAGIHVIRWYMNSQPDRATLVKMIEDIQDDKEVQQKMAG